jgi:PAS domain-containing protein
VVGLQNNGEESRRAEAALREGEEHFRLLVQGAKNHAIFMLDPQARIVSWNPGAEHIKKATGKRRFWAGISRYSTPKMM